jgi:histone H3/H4
MAFIPEGTIKRMLKEFYPDDRVSSGAIARLVVVAEDFIRMTYLDARKFADASNRKTISEKDMVLASGR